MKKNGKTNLDLRHDLSSDFVQALAVDWREHGAATIQSVREKAPDNYCQLIATVVPKEMLISADKVAGDYSDCNSMHDIGIKLLRQIGVPEGAATETMIEAAVEANAAFIDRLELIARGN